MNYVYIIMCRDNSLYTGWTNNLEKRFKMHCDGKGAKYTRGRGPLKIVYFEEFEDKVLAMKREYEIKKLSKKDKLKLIENKNK
ncbi:GIY-YIG nuclease family protein [Clostridium sp. Ade.TY]|uniref:GIY-YIG nuclease family protein n=1 Tax=Clostridium sp. Ade.TY TaxID=1391647 RepID=UPI00042A58FB|nr:GIY-YIG nuclease family protein [Clostridium sp. Ade.TY]